MLYRLATRPLLYVLKELFSLKPSGKAAVILTSELPTELQTVQVKNVIAGMLAGFGEMTRLFLTEKGDLVFVAMPFSEERFQQVILQAEQVIKHALACKVFPLNQESYQELVVLLDVGAEGDKNEGEEGKAYVFPDKIEGNFFSKYPVLQLSATVHQQAFTLCTVNRDAFEKEKGAVPRWIWLDVKKRFVPPSCDAFTACEFVFEAENDNPFVLLNVFDFMTHLTYLKQVIQDLKKQQKKVILTHISADLYWLLNFEQLNPDMIGVQWDLSKTNVIKAILKRHAKVVLQDIETQTDLKSALEVGGQFFTGSFINDFIATARHKKCPQCGACCPEKCAQAFEGREDMCVCPEHLKNWLFTLPRGK